MSIFNIFSIVRFYFIGAPFIAGANTATPQLGEWRRHVRMLVCPVMDISTAYPNKYLRHLEKPERFIHV